MPHDSLNPSPADMSNGNGKPLMAPSTTPPIGLSCSPWNCDVALAVVEPDQDPFMTRHDRAAIEHDSELKAEALPFHPKPNSGLNALNANSLPESEALSKLAMRTSPPYNKPSDKPLGTYTSPPDYSFQPVVGPSFTTDSDTDFDTSRFVAIHGLPLEWLFNGSLEQWMDSNQCFDGLTSHKLISCKDDTLAIYCCFNDLRDVIKCYKAFKTLRPDCLPISIASKAYFDHDSSRDATSPFDGQVEIITTIVGHDSEADLRIMFTSAHQYARVFGPLRTFALLRSIGVNKAAFRAEYWMLSTSQEMLRRAGAEYQISKTVTAVIYEYLPEQYARRAVAAESRPSSTTHDVMEGRGSSGVGQNLRSLYEQSPASHNGGTSLGSGYPAYTIRANNDHVQSAPHMKGDGLITPHTSRPSSSSRHSPTHYAQSLQYHRSDVSGPVTPHGGLPLPRTPSGPLSMYGSARRTPLNGATGYSPSSASRRGDSSNQPQTVDIAKIESGLDVRTTLMVRNVPNRLNWEDFKEILDQTNFGQYDFSYLRTDFGNNCNVGYAFVNFTRPEYIIEFFHQRVGRLWPKSNSDKILEVSYATIQGQDCLIQKFRNSSVMHEYPGFRPKLWYTFDSDDMPASKKIGDEQVFPSADNLSKLTRSLDNAQAIGLYPPRGSRSGGRRRRGQYDRGTPHALFEEHLQTPSSRTDEEAHYNDLSSPFGQRMVPRSAWPSQYGSPLAGRSERTRCAPNNGSYY